jgi:hypothetical protein
MDRLRQAYDCWLGCSLHYRGLSIQCVHCGCHGVGLAACLASVLLTG